jgi:8-oxo-dGTP pyrophosphatase MutT (NUDIX family)
VSRAGDPDPATPTVQAAGGVVRRGEQVVVIHRPAYDDWSLPKGKLADGERAEAGALREVEEETGLRCRIVAPLGETRYRDRRGRPKRVRYWLMEPEAADEEKGFAPNAEVDELRWLAPDEAARLLTYPHDRALLDRLPGGRHQP